MKKTLSALIIAAAATTASAADSYGYLAFWQNPADSSEAAILRTTGENLDQTAAAAELNAFCRGRDTLSGIKAGQPSGCKFVQPLSNSCVAVAYPQSQGRLTPENAVVITSPLFRNVHQTAMNQCAKKYGSQGRCKIETVYCTASDYYGGTLKTIWNRLK